MLGVLIDNKLTFNHHVSKLCEKVGQKIHVFARASNQMSKEKLRILMNAFFTPQFGCCPLVWMFHGRTLALRLVCNGSSSYFSEILEKDNSFTIHHRNNQKLAIEIYKVKHYKAPKIMSELFSQVNLSHNLRKDTKFHSYNVKAVMVKLNIMLPRCYHISDRKSRIWFLPKSKTLKNQESFGKKLKMEARQIPIQSLIYPCRLLS